MNKFVTKCALLLRSWYAWQLPGNSGASQGIARGFKPPATWRLQVMVQAGAHVKEEVVRALIVLITNAQDLHAYCARTMYAALQANLLTAEPSLITASTWVIGEYPSLVCTHARTHGHYRHHSFIFYEGSFRPGGMGEGDEWGHLG